MVVVTVRLFVGQLLKNLKVWITCELEKLKPVVEAADQRLAKVVNCWSDVFHCSGRVGPVVWSSCLGASLASGFHLF